MLNSSELTFVKQLIRPGPSVEALRLIEEIIHKGRVHVPLQVEIGKILSGMISVVIELFIRFSPSALFAHRRLVNGRADHWNIGTEIHFVPQPPGSLNEMLAQEQAGLFEAFTGFTRQADNE